MLISNNEVDSMFHVLKKISQIILVLIAASLTSCASLNDQYPATSADGLKRIESKYVDAVYWDTGATLSSYERVQILDVNVAFEKDWLRDYNRDVRGLRGRADQSDMDRIKKALASEFVRVFTKELQEKGGYEITDQPAANVLQLSPSIVDLDVTAPDLMIAGRTTTYTAEAGEMTLVMDLYDSVSGAKIGAVFDRKRSRDWGNFRISNRVTNKSEADIILRKWARLLVDALDEAHGK
jgi:hypothetical protein